MSDLKKLRHQKGLTQSEASSILGVSLRSYKEYENNENKFGTLKYKSMVNELDKYISIDEEHGILSLEEIKKHCKNVFEEYDVKFCFLFGSYAKGKATEKSDVDLLISTDITGLKFYGLVERLREALHKKVDLLDIRQLVENKELIEEILKDGVKIYEQ